MTDKASASDIVGPLGRQLDAMRALLEESDRGCVLVSAAWVDERLESLLRRRFRLDSGDNKELFDWLLIKRPLPPIGSFGVKNSLCRALGLTGDDSFRSIKALADIRNKFAHISMPVTFENAEVSKKVDTLCKSAPVKPLKEMFAVSDAVHKRRSKADPFRRYHKWIWGYAPTAKSQFSAARLKFMTAAQVLILALVKAEDDLQRSREESQL